MTETEIKIQINGKDAVFFPRTKRWQYDGVDETTIYKISPELASQINEALSKYVTEYEDKVKAEEEQRKANILEQKNKELKEFMELVSPLIPNGYTVQYISNISEYTDVRSITILKDRADATIQYDDHVSTPGAWHSHKTDMPWVRRFDWKRQRFSTIDKAIKNAIQKIDEQVARNKREQECLDNTKTMHSDINKQLKNAGIIHTISEKWHHTGKHGGYSEKRDVALIHISGSINNYEDKVKVSGDVIYSKDTPLTIHNVRIKGIFSIEQFKQIAELIKQINPKCD